MSSEPPTIAINPTVESKESDNTATNNEKTGDNNAGPSTPQPRLRWKRILGVKDSADPEASDSEKEESTREKWTMGILNDPQTDQVPGELPPTTAIPLPSDLDLI
jgi:hypothetical protein